MDSPRAQSRLAPQEEVGEISQPGENAGGGAKIVESVARRKKTRKTLAAEEATKLESAAKEFSKRGPASLDAVEVTEALEVLKPTVYTRIRTH